MEEKRLKQFTFYDLYYEALKGLPDEAAGRMAKNICRFMFTNEEIPEPQDDRENFFWSNIKDVLEEVKRIEESGRKPKNLNEKMSHFTFTDTYGKALKLMSDAESGQYIKAICEYMFFGTERKLKPPVDMYFSFAKKKLELSRKRKSSGSKGGATVRIKVTDEEIEKATEKELKAHAEKRAYYDFTGETNYLRYMTTEGKLTGNESKKFTMLDSLQKFTGVFNGDGMIGKVVKDKTVEREIYIYYKFMDNGYSEKLHTN